jgi:hypothetical protein
MWRLTFLLFLLAGYPGIQVISLNSSRNNDPDNPLRIEIPARSVNETYRIIPCGTNGLIMFFRSLEVAGESRTKWYFTCYDTNLQQLWVKSVPLINEHDYRFYQAGRDTLALLFVHNGKSKGIENSYEILRIVEKTGTMILNAGKVDEGMTVDAFGLQNDRAWLGMNAKGQAGKIMNIRLKEGTGKAFSLGTGNQITLLWMQPDTVPYLTSAFVSRQVSKKSTEYYLVRYDTNGTIRRESLIGTQSGTRTLTHVKVAAGSPGEELLLGSYGQGETGSSQKNRLGGESTGFFASPVRNGAQKSISFYNFLELQHASSIVGENDIMNLKKKALKKNRSLAEYSLDFSVFMHEIGFINNQYLLTAEVFAPQYHTENFTDFDFYGRPYTNSYSVFDGYRFYNAIVAGFDPEGKLLWDNNIEIRNLVSPDLTPKVVTYADGKDLVLCYISDGKIGSKIIQEDSVVEKLDFSPMEMLYPNDKMLSETKGMLVQWYGNYFLSYGYQDIKNVALETNNKRLVFYFSKLRFEK